MGITVESQRVAADEIKIVDPGGVILARTLSTVLRLHCKGRVGAGPAAEASVRAVAAEGTETVDAGAAVQASVLLVPAVVVRLAPRGITVLALNVYRRAHSHVQLESASAITRIQAHTCPQTFLHILGSGRSKSRRLARHSVKGRHR